jgi:hypothetical protein
MTTTRKSPKPGTEAGAEIWHDNNCQAKDKICIDKRRKCCDSERWLERACPKSPPKGRLCRNLPRVGHFFDKLGGKGFDKGPELGFLGRALVRPRQEIHWSLMNETTHLKNLNGPRWLLSAACLALTLLTAAAQGPAWSVADSGAS